MARRKESVIPDAILDQLLAGADAKTAFDQNGLLDQLKKALTERALKAELDHHLAGDESGNRRNGYGRKTVLADGGSMVLSIPRDRTGTFDPALIGKYQRRFPGFDEKIVSMYARGMSTQEIIGHLRELYGIEVSADLISTVTDAVIEEVTAWQNRPLEAVYPLVFLDAIRVKTRDEGALIALRSGPSDTQARLCRRCATRPSLWPSGCGPTAPRRCWACGSNRTKVDMPWKSGEPSS
jgi:putative transposase